MTMLPDVDQESYAQYSADQFTSSTNDRIASLAAVPTPDPGLVSHLGGGPSPDQASAGSTADTSPPPASSPSPEPGPAAPAPAPLPVPYAPVTAPLQAPQPAPTPAPSAQPDWIAGALNAVDQAGGDVQKFAQGLQTGAGDLIGSALNAADAAGADVQKFVSALPPVPAAAPTDTGPASSDDQAAYIRQAAAARGIDPDTAVKVASSEGLNTYVGDNGSSFGPFQLHYGGVASGGNAVSGLGDEFTRQTGLDARDPSTWRQQVDFALNQAAQGGWAPWHGAARVGIGNQQGIGPNAAPGAVTVADQADRAQTQTVSPSTSALMSKVQPFLGDPYVWGGKDPNTGFDCSGFVGYVEGTGQPESTTTLYAKSGGIDQKSAQPGDLVFYNMGQSDMHLQHVGVYLGNGKIAQAGGTNDTVNVADVNQKVGSAPEFRRLDAGSTPPTAGQPAQVQQVNNDPIGWLGQQKDALTSSIGNGVSALGADLQPQVSQPVATQTMPSDSLTDPLGTRYTLSPTGQPLGATTLPTTSAAPQDTTSATPAPQGPLEAVKQKFSDAIDALGGLLAPAQPAASAAAGAAQDFAQNGPIGATRGALQGATNYVTSGQARSDLADTLSSQADQSPLGPAIPAPVQSVALNLAAGLVRAPSAVDSAKTMMDLQQKYNSFDPSVMTPEDRQAYQSSMLAVGGLLGGEGATYDKFGVQEGFVPPAAKQVPPVEPAAPALEPAAQAPGLIPNANRARANAADIASGGTRAERLAQPPPTQAADTSDAVLQGLINEAKQRGIDTSSIEAQIKPPITADMITAPGPAEGPAAAGGRIQPTQPASEARSVREIVSTTVANKQGPPGITVEPQGFLGRSTPEMGSAVVYRDETGTPQGILSITNDERGNPDVAEVAVNPAFQRQGIATQLYQAAKDAGINVDAVTGRGGYTPEGAAFAQSRVGRAPPPSAEAPPAGAVQVPTTRVQPADVRPTYQQVQQISQKYVQQAADNRASAAAPPPVQYDANGNVARVNGRAVGGGGAGNGGPPTTTGGTPPPPPEGPQGLPTTPAPVQRAGITPDTVQIAHQRIDRAVQVGSSRNYDMHQQLDTMLANGASPAEVARFLSGTVEGQTVTPMNILRTVRTGSMAGGLTTEGKVLAGPVIQTAMRAPVAAVKSLVTGNPGDIRAGLQGSMAGLAEGAQEALQTLRYGINYRSALAGGAQGGYGFAPGLDVMGKTPLTRAAGTLATGLVRSHGAVADLSASIGRGAALAQGATPEAAAQAGQHWALRSGQYGSVGQAVSKALEGLRNVNPAMDVAGQILVPFYRVGYNAFTQGVERSPVGLVGTAADVARGKLPASVPDWMRGPYAPGGNAGGAVTPVGDRLTNNMFGVGLAGLGLAQAASGNITGQSPPVGSPKWSIRVPETAKLGPVEAVAKRDPQGNLWVPIRSLGPAGEALAQSAALYEAARDGKGSVPDMAARTASEYVNHLEDETWLGSITSALNLIADVGNATSPLKLAASQAKRDIAYQASSLGKSFIPQEKLGEQVSKAFGNYVPPAAKPAATAAPVAPARTPVPTTTRRYVPPARATSTPRTRP